MNRMNKPIKSRLESVDPSSPNFVLAGRELIDVFNTMNIPALVAVLKIGTTR